MRAVGGRGAWIHHVFLVLLVLNLVSAFQALGTMMSLGLMILPAISARFWSKNIDTTIGLSIVFAFFAAYVGLLFSYHYGLPSGPAIVLTGGILYVLSIFFGRHGSIITRLFPRRHYAN